MIFPKIRSPSEKQRFLINAPLLIFTGEVPPLEHVPENPCSSEDNITKKITIIYMWIDST